MFIISLTYKVPIEEVEKHLEAHIDYLKQEYENGSFIASGRKIPRTGGIIFSKLNTRSELDAVLEKDPFYIHQVATFDVIEFAPSMTAEGFENLKD